MSQARQALADFVTAHPDVFASPGRAESAGEILEASTGSQTTDAVRIGMFSVDLDKKTYKLFHGYKDPDSGWYEEWVWDGTFSQTPDGRWKVDQPQFIKEWGEYP